MPLYWKVYGALLGLLLLAVGGLAAVMGFVEAGRSADMLRNQQMLYAVAAAARVESGYNERDWPFEMFTMIARDKNFNSWRVVDGAGAVILSDKPLGKTSAEERQFFREHAGGLERRLIRAPSGADVWVIPVRMRDETRPGSFWLEFNDAAIREQAWGVARNNVIAGLCIVIILMPVSFWVTRRILRPLESLASAATSMGRGDLEVSLPAPSNDEIGRLVVAFDSLAHGSRAKDARIGEQMRALEENRRDLEFHVCQRTLELSKANEELKREITVRHFAEASLQGNEARYRALFEEANDGICILRDGVCIDCNPKCVEMFQRAKEEIVGGSPQRFSPRQQANGGFSEEMFRERLELAGRGVPQCFEWVYTRCDAQPFDAEVSLSRIEFSGKVCVQAVIRDITERKRRRACAL